MNLLSTILSNEMGRGTFDNSYFSFFGGFCDRKEKGLCQFDYYMERYETLQINQYLHNAIEEAETIKYQISMNFLFDERVTNIMLLKQLELALKKKIKTPTIQKELTQCTINK